MFKKFKSVYHKLPKNYQNIISNTIAQMDKKHRRKPTGKKIKIKKVIDFYRRENNMSQKDLLEECKKDVTFSEDTYKSILRRNLVKLDNYTIKLVSKILGIPDDFSVKHKSTEHKSYSFTDDYYYYLMEFQMNSVYDNFQCLSKNNQRAILYLANALYYNQIHPELFLEEDEQL